MAGNTNEDWAPKSREDWTELFADGFTLAQSRRDEADAKAKAAADEAAKTADAEGDAPKPSFRERILGL